MKLRIVRAEFRFFRRWWFDCAPFDIPPSAGDEVQDKSIQDESITYMKDQ
jgi:hypothetical protein